MLSFNNPYSTTNHKVLGSTSHNDQQEQQENQEPYILKNAKLPTISTMLGNPNDIRHVVSQWRKERREIDYDGIRSNDDLYNHNLGIICVPPLVSSKSSSTAKEESFSPKTPSFLDNNNVEFEKYEQDQRQQQWIHILPYDILNQIFGQLSMHDLVICLAVCRSWFSFILDYSLFQHCASVELPSFIAFPNMFDFMLTRQHERTILSMHDELNVVRQTKEAGETILRFIMYSARNFKFRSLYLKDWEYDIKCDEDTLYSLYTALRQFVPQLETLSLINVIELPSIAYLWRLFSTCNSVKRLTIVCNQSHRGQQHQKTVTSTENYHFCYVNDEYDGLSSIEIAHCVSHEPLYPVSMTALPLTSLTYLKLSLPDMYRDHYRIGGAASFPDIFPCCPNLQHLYLDSLDNMFHAHAIYEAYQHCSQLENVAVSPLAEIPTEIIIPFDDGNSNSNISLNKDKSDNDNSNTLFPVASISNNFFMGRKSSKHSSSSSAFTPTQLLQNSNELPQHRRLIFTQGNCKGRNPLRRYDLCDSGCLHSNSNYLVPIFKKYRKTLDLLYLQYDGEGKSTSNCIHRLGQYGGAPKLRELHVVADGKVFSLDDDDDEYTIHNMSSYCYSSAAMPITTASSSSLISKQLATLISFCPSLQVLVITSNDGSSVSMTIDNQLLHALSTSCPQLGYLTIRGKHTEITTQGLLDFASATSNHSCLKYLNIDCCVWDDDLVMLITRLKQLKSLRLLNTHASKSSFRK
ncbi:hypothetical protein INT45_006755 [Circinella minor]|uniref:F-box domain-containing protein n=1 Tax=Circinella minor TaxID=1195481 RepID=A0A8H7S940_9FUNG|nr:hypothetical protein INT45_006755 [Circinella minor]